MTSIGVLTDRELNRWLRPADEGCFGALETARGCLPLRSLDVRGQVAGLLAHVTVVSEFVNAFAEALEATYIFPLPDRFGVTAFRLTVGERVLSGRIKERGEARREYDEAIQRGHRAAIAEQERPDVFTVRAGNIAPGETVAVTLEVSGPLQVADGEAAFRFPLVVAPRYIPGVSLDGAPVGRGVATDTDAVPDASRITPPVRLPGMPNPVRLGLSVTIDPCGLPVEGLAASLHAVDVVSDDLGRAVVTLAPGTERLDRDFILRWRIGGRGIQTGLAVHRPKGDAEGTYALTVVGPTLAQAGVRPRDVVVVLDRSGSMQGWKIAAARRAAGRIVDALTDHDRLGVLLFDSTVDEFRLDPTGGLVTASDRARYRAVEFLGRADARGGTELGPALERGVAMLGPAAGTGRDRVLVLVTDGQVGNEDQLLAWMRTEAADVRVHTVGIDRAVNASFLGRLAEPSGGTCDLVESEEQLDRVMMSLHRRIGGPVLTDVAVSGGDLELDLRENAPAHAVDVFPGVPALLLGRFRGEPRQKLTVTGRLKSGEPFEVPVQPVVTEDPAVRVAWARHRILDMEHAYATNRGRDRDLARAITEFSIRHGVLSRFTAFVVVDRSEVVGTGEVHRVTQPVESPSGWAAPVAGPAELASMSRTGVRRLSAPVSKMATVYCADDMGPPSSVDLDRELGQERRGLSLPSSWRIVENVIRDLSRLLGIGGGAAPGLDPMRLFGPGFLDRVRRFRRAVRRVGAPEALERAWDELVREVRRILGDVRAAGPGLATLAAILEDLLRELEAARQRGLAPGGPDLDALCQRLDDLAGALRGRGRGRVGVGSERPPGGREGDFWM